MIPKACERLAEWTSLLPKCQGTRRGKSLYGMGISLDVAFVVRVAAFGVVAERAAGFVAA